MNFKILKEMIAEYNKNSKLTNNVISVFHTRVKIGTDSFVVVQLRDVSSGLTVIEYSVKNDSFSTYANLRDKASKGLINEIVFSSLNNICQKKSS